MEAAVGLLRFLRDTRNLFEESQAAAAPAHPHVLVVDLLVAQPFAADAAALQCF
jgi:hypothetical protein